MSDAKKMMRIKDDKSRKCTTEKKLNSTIDELENTLFGKTTKTSNRTVVQADKVVQHQPATMCTIDETVNEEF
jgi:hypothetical protein